MKKRFKILLHFGILVSLFSCELDQNNQIIDEGILKKENSIINDKNLEKFADYYGFKMANIKEFDDFYLIEDCIGVDKQTLINGGYDIKSNPNAQARTTGIVNSTPWVIRTIRVRIDNSIPTSGVDNWRPEIAQALDDMNSINNFRLHFELVTSGSHDILIRSDNNVLQDEQIALAQWPAGGNPGFEILINLDFWREALLSIGVNEPGGWNVPSGVKRRNIVHEIGHNIGYRHTNHLTNNNGGPEGAGTIGVHEIPGTWTNDAGSVMNGGTATQTWNNFSVLDILANRAVYPIDPGESPLFTYVKDFSSTIKSHNWTGEWSEYGNISSSGYNYRGYTGFIYLYQKANTVPLYRYIHSSNNYYITTNPNLATTYPSYTLNKTLGYVYTSPGSNRIPVYEYYNNNQGHFFTTNFGDSWMTGSGWSGGGIAFYVEKIL
ncbi:M57 family metalloprotease [Algoriphagus pacificus]|uniref:DUF5648 domain-containing protein n=1 Tax=Algoriphagus pacificus TaxID=2811234 RepID=A0ABS3CAU4_9BACT|nr:M57 family metalloprotease [Algoriphagus pacificus]MBN7814220.1 hypothetical protein [Algoriphagus pacificus]